MELKDAIICHTPISWPEGESARPGQVAVFDRTAALAEYRQAIAPDMPGAEIGEA